MFSVSPKAPITSIPVRNEPGIAMPTKRPERTPSAAITTTMTSRIALSTLFCRSPSTCRMSFERSWL